MSLFLPTANLHSYTISHLFSQLSTFSPHHQYFSLIIPFSLQTSIFKKKKLSDPRFSSNYVSAPFSSKTPWKICPLLLMSHVLLNPIQIGFLPFLLLSVSPVWPPCFQNQGLLFVLSLWTASDMADLSELQLCPHLAFRTPCLPTGTFI